MFLQPLSTAVSFVLLLQNLNFITRYFSLAEYPQSFQNHHHPWLRLFRKSFGVRIEFSLRGQVVYPRVLITVHHKASPSNSPISKFLCQFAQYGLRPYGDGPGVLRSPGQDHRGIFHISIAEFNASEAHAHCIIGWFTSRRLRIIQCGPLLCKLAPPNSSLRSSNDRYRSRPNRSQHISSSR